MSISVLFDIQKEVRRLLVAGSELAAGDFRLEKLLPAMRKSGESVPVFARVADAIQKVVEPGLANKSENLLELANLVNAVLYTQGQTGVEGTLSELATADLPYTTEVPYRRLMPVIDALTGTGQGRTEIIRDAFSEGMWKDLRLIHPLIHALDDSYAEIPVLAAEILVQFGEDIVPVVKASLDYEGGKGHGRRVELVSRLMSDRGRDFYLTVIEKGTGEVKASGIRALKDLPDCEPLLLELSRDRKKDIREASLLSLAYIGTQRAVDRIFEVFDGKERGLAILPIKVSHSTGINKFLLEEAEKELGTILKSEKGFSLFAKKTEPPEKEVLDRFATLLDCMLGKSDEKLSGFFKKCLAHIGHLQQFTANPEERLTTNLAELVAENLMQTGTKEALELLDSIRGKYGNYLVRYSFEAAVRIKEPAYVFDCYSKFIREGRKSMEGKVLLEIMNEYIDFMPAYQITDMYSYNTSYYNKNMEKKKNIQWDGRWVKVLAELDETSLVCRLASPRIAGCVDYLLKKLDGNKELQHGIIKDIVRGLLQAGYPKTPEVCADLIEYNFKKSGYYSNYYFNDFTRVLKLLPKSSAGLIENLAKNHDNASAEKLYEVAYYLHNKE